MTRTKLGLLGFCALVVSMMSMSVGTAQGTTPTWLILNATHTVATNLKAQLIGEKDSTHLTLEGELAGLKIAITCTNFTLKEFFIQPVEGIHGKAIFTGCKGYKTAPLTEEYKCTVNSSGVSAGTIETNELDGSLESLGTKLVVNMSSPAGPAAIIVTFQMKGVECPLPELNQLHGTVVFEDCLGQSVIHKVKHLVQADSVNTKLYVGGHGAKQLEITKLLGSGWVLLTGAHAGREWSGMEF